MRFRGDASTIGDASLDWLKEFALVKACLKEAPFEEICDDDIMIRTLLA